MIWKSIPEVASIINCALIVDAAESYKKSKDEYKSYSKYLAINKLKTDDVLDKTIKFMRILSSTIVDDGTQYNTEDRVTYLAVPKSPIWDQEVGHKFRMANWVSTYGYKDTVDKFDKDSNYIILKFNIKAECYNAGMINKFGESQYPDKEETLFPPYTIIEFKSIESGGKYITLDVVRDNKSPA